MSDFDQIDNLSLIENGLDHLQFELSRYEPSYFRIARESHMIFYRSMIEALKGTANLAVTGRPSKDREHKYQLGNEPFKKIYKISIEGCSNAWRFSEPELCEKPRIDTKHKRSPDKNKDDFLISFYDALAMIQSECFMINFVDSEIVNVSDEDMKTLEWLHEEIRNVYEHFIPSAYLAPIDDLLLASALCLSITSKLLFESKNVIFYQQYKKKRLKKLLNDILKAIRHIKQDKGT